MYTVWKCTWIEVRGQLSVVGSLLLPCRFHGSNAGPRARCRCFYLRSHLTGLLFYILERISLCSPNSILLSRLPEGWDCSWVSPLLDRKSLLKKKSWRGNPMWMTCNVAWRISALDNDNPGQPWCLSAPLPMALFSPLLPLTDSSACLQLTMNEIWTLSNHVVSIINMKLPMTHN